jgi:hypothetical protein
VQHHPRREILFYVISIGLQAHALHGLTTYIGETEAHNNSNGDGMADLLANAVADGQPHDAIYVKGAELSLGHWTITSTITPLHVTTKLGNLMAIAQRDGT